MDRAKIEEEARHLQKEIYRAKSTLFPMNAHPLTMLRPEVAAQVLDLEYIVMDRIPTDQYGLEVAGLLDLPGNAMYISQRFNFRIQRFTAAHEIGHAVLHPNLPGLFHRDLPVFEMQFQKRPQIEQEADYFSACWLAPRKMVTEEFQNRFGKAPLRLSEDVAFHLRGKSTSDLFIEPSGGLKFPCAVASAQKFGGHPFKSLADHFNVSVSAMAIRLRELELVRD